MIWHIFSFPVPDWYAAEWVRRFRGGMEVRVGHSTSEALVNHVYFACAFQALSKLYPEGEFGTRLFFTGGNEGSEGKQGGEVHHRGTEGTESLGKLRVERLQRVFFTGGNEGSEGGRGGSFQRREVSPWTNSPRSAAMNGASLLEADVRED